MPGGGRKCDATKEQQEIPALGHQFSEWKTITSATCQSEGLEQRACEICGVTESRNLDKTSHDWESDYTIDKEATCTEEGSQSIHCKNCDATMDSQTIPMKAHEIEEVLTKATPEKDGLIENKCKNCGSVLSQTVISRPASFAVEAGPFTYNGKAFEPAVTVKAADGTVIDAGSYDVTYRDNVNAGTAKAMVTFKGNYEGVGVVDFVIGKAAQPMTLKAKLATVKYTKVKKKAQTIAIKKALTFTTAAEGTVTYAKKGGSAKVTINKKTGKLTVKKGTKKGTYKIRVSVTASGSANFEAGSKTVTLKIRVK